MLLSSRLPNDNIGLGVWNRCSCYLLFQTIFCLTIHYKTFQQKKRPLYIFAIVLRRKEVLLSYKDRTLILASRYTDQNIASATFSVHHKSIYKKKEKKKNFCSPDHRPKGTLKQHVVILLFLVLHILYTRILLCASTHSNFNLICRK